MPLYLNALAMSKIPDEIKAVERPKSTVVKQYGDRYLVIKRTSKRVNGKPRPVDLGTIGEIIDGKYVEIRKEPRRQSSKRKVDVKDYGQFALCNRSAGNLFQKLAGVFDIKTAKQLYMIALLRAANPGIRNRDIQMAYETSWASEVYAGVPLSENVISNLLLNVGMEYSLIVKFMRERVTDLAGKRVVIDGVLKDNNSVTNSFSEYSRKARTKGSEDISMLYAYDLETQEPVAVKVYPGNMLDLTSLESFISEMMFRENTLIFDKGFFSREVFERLDKMEGLEYIAPLKQSNKIIDEYGMLNDICTPLKGYADGTVLYKKAKTEDGMFLYAYRDPQMAADQEVGYIVHGTGKGTFSEDRLKGKRKEFGTIVFMSKADMAPLDVYMAYKSRWDIECMFDMYKNIIELDTVNVQGDYRLYATEFINYLSTIITARVRRTIYSTKIVVSETKSGVKKTKPANELYSYKQIFHYLSKCKKVRVDVNGLWIDNQRLKYVDRICSALGV